MAERLAKLAQNLETQALTFATSAQKEDYLSLIGNNLRLERDNLRLGRGNLRPEGINLRLEGDNLRQEGDNLRLEGGNLRVEGDNLHLESDNLHLGVDNLHPEGDNLCLEGDNLLPAGDNLERGNLCYDVLQGEGEPLVEGDGAVSILIHLGKHLGPEGGNGGVHCYKQNLKYLQMNKTFTEVSFKISLCKIILEN